MDKRDFKDNTMWAGADSETFKKAKSLRLNMTEAEKVLWEELKNGRLGEKFRRQHPLQIYIIDFYYHKWKLCVEIDGGYHLEKQQQEQDRIRTKHLNELGLKVIRFSNEEVMNNLKYVVEEIKKEISKSHPPSPLKGDWELLLKRSS